jgi:hypothetical protein
MPYVPANLLQVHPFRYLFCAIYANEIVLVRVTLWHTISCLSRTDLFHAADLRSIYGAEGHGDLSEIGKHDFHDVNAGEIVQRIMRSREMYEERQRVKGEKVLAKKPPGDERRWSKRRGM